MRPLPDGLRAAGAFGLIARNRLDATFWPVPCILVAWDLSDCKMGVTFRLTVLAPSNRSRACPLVPRTRRSHEPCNPLLAARSSRNRALEGDLRADPLPDRGQGRRPRGGPHGWDPISQVALPRP